ncbi:MAG: hypothetical protein J2P36_06885 [Ktedonobacteraceae bacterium]|nr:hypothetical protein [Ktedonobacteraceae bacterium]
MSVQDAAPSSCVCGGGAELATRVPPAVLCIPTTNAASAAGAARPGGREGITRKEWPYMLGEGERRDEERRVGSGGEPTGPR